MSYKKIIAVLAIALASFCAFAGGAQEDDGYTFAMNAEWPPLEYIDENGDMVGFEVDLIAAMSEITGIPMECRNTAWDTIFAGLANGQYDAVASGVTVTEERKKTMDFSTVILKINQAIISRKENTQYTGPESLFGKTVGVQMGTTGHFALDEYPEITVKAYDSIGLAIEDMVNGNLDACVCDSVIASDYVLANESYKEILAVTGTASSAVEDIAIAFPKGSELLGIVNDAIAQLDENGTLDELYAKWNLIRN